MVEVNTKRPHMVDLHQKAVLLLSPIIMTFRWLLRIYLAKLSFVSNTARRISDMLLLRR